MSSIGHAPIDQHGATAGLRAGDRQDLLAALDALDTVVAADQMAHCLGVITACFARMPGPLSLKHERLLHLLLPRLHTPLERILRAGGAAPRRPPLLLTARQQQVLRWVQAGKTNEEVAMILGMTLSNVKYHLRQAYKRLGVINRVQAASRLVQLDLDGKA